MIEKSRAEIRAAIGAKFEESKQEAHVPDQVMVSASAAALEDMEKKGYAILRPLRHTDYHLVRIPTGRTVESAIDELGDMSGVTDVELDGIAEPGALPNDPFLAQGMPIGENITKSQLELMVHMDIAGMWDRLARYPGPITPNAIAVIDTGVFVEHEEFDGQLLLPGYNSSDGSDNIVPYGNLTSLTTQHGTSVSGIICAKANNEKGIAGFAPYSKVYPIRSSNASGGTTVDSAIAAINHCMENDIRIMNFSSGWTGAPSAALQQACDAAQAAGFLIFSIAHNDGTSAVRYPGSFSSVICVAGLAQEEISIATGSNYGEGVDFCAPYNALTPYYNWQGYYYFTNSGTSMSSPMLASLAGAMLAINPALTWAEVYNTLRRSCIPEIPRGGTRYGHGIPQFGKAIQYAIDSTHYSGLYSAEGYIRGLYKGGANGEPIRIGAAYYGDQDGTPRKFWVGTA